MEITDKTKFDRHTVTFIFLIHIIVAGFFYSRGAYGGAYYWAALFIMTASLPYVRALFTKNFIVYEAIYLFMTGFAVSHTANLFLPPAEINLDFSSIMAVMKFAILGILFVILGYRVRLGEAFARKLPLKNFIVRDEEILKIPAKFYLLWLILFILTRLRVSLPSNIFAMLEALKTLLIFAALTIDTYLYFSEIKPSGERKRETRHLWRVLFFLGIYTVECVLQGFGGKVIMPLIFIYFAYIKVKKRMPIVSLLGVCVAAAIFLVYVIPFTKDFRREHGRGKNIRESFNIALKETASEDPGERLKQSVIRFSHPLGMAVIGVELREEGRRFTFYSSIGDFIARFIPRFIWPNKPVSFNWNTLGRELGILQSTDYSTAVGLPLLASFILNGGPTGVAIGMFVVGIILKMWWHWLIVRSGGNFLTFSIYLILMYSWMFGGDELGTILVYNTMFLSYTYIFMGFVKRKQGKAA